MLILFLTPTRYQLYKHLKNEVLTEHGNIVLTLEEGFAYSPNCLIKIVPSSKLLK